MGFFGKLFGRGEKINKELLSAAKSGHAEAQSELGSMYRFGEGVQKDYDKAFKLYSKAAEQGHTFALYYLGLMYALGQGVQQDISIATALVMRAAEQGHPTAKETLQEIRKVNPIY